MKDMEDKRKDSKGKRKRGSVGDDFADSEANLGGFQKRIKKGGGGSGRGRGGMSNRRGGRR